MGPPFSRSSTVLPLFGELGTDGGTGDGELGTDGKYPVFSPLEIRKIGERPVCPRFLSMGGC